MTRRMTISIVLALILGCAQAALAGPVNCCLYGTTGATGGSTLVQLDPVTGALVRTIGPVGYDVNGLAWDPLTQTMYAGTSYNDPVFNGLIAIDLTTGAGAQVGANLWGSADPDGYPQAAVALTISATGQMFAWCEDCYDITVGYYRDDLVSINRTTGVATRVGDSGISTGALGLDFDANGTLTLVKQD